GARRPDPIPVNQRRMKPDRERAVLEPPPLHLLDISAPNEETEVRNVMPVRRQRPLARMRDLADDRRRKVALLADRPEILPDPQRDGHLPTLPLTPSPPGAGEREGSPLALLQRRPWPKATLREAAAGRGEGLP